MAANTAILRVQVLVDAAKAAAGMDKAAGGVGKFQKGMKQAAIPAAAALTAIVAFGKGAVNAASDAQQAMGGIDAVFGDTADTVKGFANTAADSVGLAASSYGELATVIGSQLKNAGTPMDQLAGKTDGLIKLGADLAATYGGSTTDAVSALSSALKGEMDPLERYGTSLNQAAIKAQMAADGTDKLTGKQAAAAKQTATLKLITKQTADATGKFAKESNTAAGQQARATAEWENAQATLGTKLLPMVTAATAHLATMAKWVAKNADVIVPIVAVLAAFAAGILVVNAAMAAFNAIMALNPVVLVIIAIVALTVGIVILWKKCDGFRAFFLNMWKVIARVATATWRAISSAARVAWAAIKVIVGAVFTVLKLYFNAYKFLALLVWKLISAGARIAWAAIKASAAAVVSWLKGAWRGTRDAIGAVFTAIKHAGTKVWGSIRSAASGAMNALLGPIHAVESAFDAVAGAIQSVISWIRRIDFPSPPKWLSKLPGVGSLSAPAAPPVARGARSPSLLGAGVPLAGAGAGGLTINLVGVLDGPDAARKIRAVLREDDRRRSGVQLRGGRNV